MIEKIRLTPTQRMEAKRPVLKKYAHIKLRDKHMEGQFQYELQEAIANTATDKAIKYFMDLLIVSNVPYDPHASCECCGAVVALDVDDSNKLVALKKLVEVNHDS